MGTLTKFKMMHWSTKEGIAYKKQTLTNRSPGVVANRGVTGFEGYLGRPPAFGIEMVLGELGCRFVVVGVVFGRHDSQGGESQPGSPSTIFFLEPIFFFRHQRKHLPARPSSRCSQFIHAAGRAPGPIMPIGAQLNSQYQGSVSEPARRLPCLLVLAN